MADIIERLKADIAAYNEHPLEIEPHRTDLHELFLDMVAGIERGEWTCSDLVLLAQQALFRAKPKC